MFDDIFEVEVAIEESPECDPGGDVLVEGRMHGAVEDEYFAEFHEFVDLLHGGRVTMVWLLLSSSFRQISVIYCTY